MFFSDEKGIAMTSKADAVLAPAWKRQCDAGLRAIEAMIEGATKIHQTQLQAAAEAHASAEATRTALAAATDPAQVFRLQTEWARANAQKSFAYWRSMAQAVVETDAELAKCMYGQAPAVLAGMVNADALGALYKRWFDSVSQVYKPVARESNS
jgi:phasin family protein